MSRIYYLLLSSIILFTACNKDKFSVESEWIAPLVKTQLTIADLIPDSLKTINGDNTVNLTYQHKYSLSELSDFFDVPDRIEIMEVTMESLVLEDRAFIDTLTLLEIYPASILLHGQTQVLESQDVTTDEGTEIDVTEEFFRTATFKEGWIDIVINNDLPVEAEVVEFELLNADDDEVVLTGSITNLQPSSVDSSSYDLAGKTVDGLLEMRVKRVKTAASNGPVEIDVYKGLRIAFTVRDLKPESATAIFPAQTLLHREDETEYTFGGAELTQIDIATGAILMKVSSTIEEAIVLDYQIPHSYQPGSTEYIQKQWTIPAAPKGETVYLEERFPIDGFQVQTKGKDPLTPTPNLVYNILDARIEYSGIERSLSLSDKITIEFGLVDVVPKVVYGDPGYHKVNVTDTFDIPLFKNAGGNISLEDASFDMRIQNTFGIEIGLEADSITGINNRKPNTVMLSSPTLANQMLIRKATNNGGNFLPANYTLHLDKSNSNLKLFLENLPDQIKPNLSIIIRPNGTYNSADFAFDFSDLTAEFDINIPLEIGLDKFSLSSTQDLNISESNPAKKVKAFSLVVRAKNSFPIDAGLTVDFLDVNGQTIFTLFNPDENTIAAAELDITTGKTVGSFDSEIKTTVSREQYELIKQSTQARITAQFDTDAAARHKLYDDYMIDVKIMADFVYEN